MTAPLSSHSLDKPACDPGDWLLDPKVVYLNHGAFGACPRPVLEFQTQLRQRLERQPMQFLVRDLEPLLDVARGTLAKFVGAEPDNLVFVPNTTAGVNTVLRSLDFAPGDELLVTNHEYNASRNALEFAAERSGARVVVVEIPFPLRSVEEIIAPILAAITLRTRLALLDHVTSQTGLVMPVERLVAELSARGVETLVDGAHAPGMVPLNLKRIGAAYYTGNCHKWLCAPKGAAFLCVEPRLQRHIRPLIISHGASSARTDRSRFVTEFGWTGTSEMTAYLSVPEALRFMESRLPGGWSEMMARNRALTLAAREVVCVALKIAEPCPAEFIGSIASVPLTDAVADEWPRPLFNEYPLQEVLRVKHGVEIPIIPWPSPVKRLLRISAQLYNSLPQYKLLAAALVAEMDSGSAGFKARCF